MKEYEVKSVYDITLNKHMPDMKITCESISDGYHTMDELYDHRRALTIALFSILDSFQNFSGCPYKAQVFKSKYHFDGSMFDGYFIVGLQLDNKSFISYHYKLEYWDAFEFAYVLDKAPEYDGHTSQDVIERLLKL